MPPLNSLVLAWLLAAGSSPDTGSTPPPAVDAPFPPVAAVALVGTVPAPAALAWRPASEQGDTVPRPRKKAVTYSDAYAKRLQLHRVLSWSMLPLFAVSYASGDKLMASGRQAPAWARQVHAPAATATAVLFGANAITGTWNLWDGRKDPNGRVKRYLHSLSFMAASGGFAYAGTVLADDAKRSIDARRTHRAVALSSMALSTASWLVMLVGN